MIYVITHRAKVTSPQKAAALRDRITDLLIEDEDTDLIHAGMANDSPTFEVAGVNTKSKEPFTQTVSADDADQAKALTEEEDDMVVAAVSPTV